MQGPQEALQDRGIPRVVGRPTVLAQHHIVFREEVAAQVLVAQRLQQRVQDAQHVPGDGAEPPAGEVGLGLQLEVEQRLQHVGADACEQVLSEVRLGLLGRLGPVGG